MSDGDSRWPLSCRGRNTIGSPAMVPRRTEDDGSPHGPLIASSRAVSRPGRAEMPDPPMMPRTAFVMISPPSDEVPLAEFEDKGDVVSHAVIPGHAKHEPGISRHN